jgi:hypothetical protein
VTQRATRWGGKDTHPPPACFSHCRPNATRIRSGLGLWTCTDVVRGSLGGASQKSRSWTSGLFDLPGIEKPIGFAGEQEPSKDMEHPTQTDGLVENVAIIQPSRFPERESRGHEGKAIRKRRARVPCAEFLPLLSQPTASYAIPRVSAIYLISSHLTCPSTLAGFPTPCNIVGEYRPVASSCPPGALKMAYLTCSALLKDQAHPGKSLNRGCGQIPLKGRGGGGKRKREQ